MKGSAFLILAVLLIPATGRTQVTAAEEAYRKAESRFHLYMEAEITSTRPRELIEQLKNKITLLWEVENAYREVVKLKETVFVVSSCYKLGLAYENMALITRRIPAHDKLTPEQKKVYQQELEAKAKPYLEKARQHFRTAVRKSRELGTLTDHARLAEQKLLELERKEKSKRRSQK